jgi:hypothetical protein
MEEVMLLDSLAQDEVFVTFKKQVTKRDSRYNVGGPCRCFKLGKNFVELGWMPTKDMIEKKAMELTKPTIPSQKRLFPQNDDEVEETTNITAYTDIVFQKMCLEGNPQFKDLTDVNLHIMEYKTNTNIQLSIINSRGSTHQNGLFSVSFGFTPDKEAIICKRNNLEHSGSIREQTAKGGRKWKPRKKELLSVCYHLFLGTNGEVPKAKHVQEAAAQHYSVTVPYDALTKHVLNRLISERYQMTLLFN